MNVISSLIILSSSLSVFNSPVKNEKLSYPCLNCDVTHKIGDCQIGVKTICSETVNNFTLENNLNFLENSNSISLLSTSSNSYFSAVEYKIPSNDDAPYCDYVAGSKLIDEHVYFENLRAFGENRAKPIYDYDINGKEVEQFADNYANGKRIGVCGYVAALILLSYFNTYYSDTIIPLSNVVYGKTFMPIDYNSVLIKKRDFSPGSDHNFLKRLYYTGPSSDLVLENPRVFQFPWLIKDIIGSWLLYAKHYDENLDFLMDYGGVNNLVEAATGNFDRAKTIAEAKQFLDNNKPVILTFFDPQNIDGLSHIVVAYGYTNDGRFIVNTGWGAQFYQHINSDGVDDIVYSESDESPLRLSYINEQYLISYTNLNLSYSKIDDNRHIYSFKPSIEQQLSSFHKFDGIDDWFCSCGKRMDCAGPFAINDEEYQLNNEYCDEEKSFYLSKNNSNCKINVFRGGYINNKYLTLSAKTKGANCAFIEYEFSRNISAVSFDAALWSNNESLKENSSISVEIFDDNVWKKVYDFSYYKMSKDKDVLFPYCLYFFKQINKIRIIIKTNDVNNTNNRGRMVIKNLKIFE